MSQSRDYMVASGEGTAQGLVMAIFLKWLAHAIAAFNSVIFLDSLRFKFTDHPNTQTIFGLLDGWARSFGAPGLFGHTGLFSQYVIGTAELFASALLLQGIFFARLRHLQALGALIGLAVMSGAVSFHLFTPLGTDPNHDGGGLFVAACIVWAGCVVLLVLRRKELGVLVNRVLAVAAPEKAAMPA